MKLAVVFLLLVIVKIGSTDMTRLREWPKGMENFDLQKSMGKWYLYEAVNPCTWKDADALTDLVYTYNMDPHGYNIDESWRKDGPCTKTKTILNSTMQPAVFKAVDQIGNLMSGTLVYMCTDYGNYGITWGCVKKSVYPGLCDGYMFGVKTRKPNPSRKIVDEINQKLHQFWGISLSDIVLVPHNNPCDKPIGMPGRMFKTY